MKSSYESPGPNDTLSTPKMNKCVPTIYCRYIRGGVQITGWRGLLSGAAVLRFRALGLSFKVCKLHGRTLFGNGYG